MVAECSVLERSAALDSGIRRWTGREEVVDAWRTGLHSLASQLDLRTFGNASLTLELNLSTFGTHPRVTWGTK